MRLGASDALALHEPRLPPSLRQPGVGGEPDRAREKPWVSEATRELLRTAPADALAPTPVPPLGPASGDWSAEQKAVASDAGETWAVMERANTARNQRRWGGGASELGHSDGWANLPSDVSFGGGGVGGGGGGGFGGGGGVAEVVVVEAVAGREYRKIRVHPVAARTYPSRACADEHGHGLVELSVQSRPPDGSHFRRRPEPRIQAAPNQAPPRIHPIIFQASGTFSGTSGTSRSPPITSESPPEVVAELAVLGVEIDPRPRDDRRAEERRVEVHVVGHADGVRGDSAEQEDRGRS